ncbi:MAG: sigma-70 family RNA polymerase sigma factor [Myxococcota bacterium]
MEYSDATLVAQVRAGQRAAFTELYRRYAPVLCRRLRRVLVRTSDVEDVMQATFLQAFRNLDRFDAKRPLGPWLHGISFRVAGTHLRALKRRSWLTVNSDAESTWVAEYFEGFEDAMERRQRLACLEQSMARLSVKNRIALALHDVEGMGVTEVGEILGLSPQAVYARVQNARRQVRKSFGRSLLDSKVRQRNQA